MNPLDLTISPEHLLKQLHALAEIGLTAEGACCRLALSEEDRLGRDQLILWMRELNLEVSIDPIGNIFGRRAGLEELPPVMTGSHIDTVRTGGRYDGPLGVLGGLEVVRTLNQAGVVTRRPLVIAAFTNEEGARFHPDMLGSLVYVGGLSLEEAYASHSADGKVLSSFGHYGAYGGEFDRNHESQLDSKGNLYVSGDQRLQRFILPK